MDLFDFSASSDIFLGIYPKIHSLPYLTNVPRLARSVTLGLFDATVPL